MLKNRIVIALLAMFLLMGTTSLTMGATPTQDMSKPIANATVYNIVPIGKYEATVTNVIALKNPVTSVSRAALTLIKKNGQTQNIVVQIGPGSEAVNMYTTLNSAYLQKVKVVVVIQRIQNQLMITSVQYA
jgi:hypothetical protein